MLKKELCFIARRSDQFVTRADQPMSPAGVPARRRCLCVINEEQSKVANKICTLRKKIPNAIY